MPPDFSTRPFCRQCRMRQRFWIGLAAVLLVAAGSVVGGAARPRRRPRRLPRDAARRGDPRRPPDRGGRRALDRPARQRRRLLPGRRQSSTATTSGWSPTRCCAQDILTATAFIQRVPAAERARYERRARLRDRRTRPGRAAAPRRRAPGLLPAHLRRRPAEARTARSATTSPPTPAESPSCAAPATAASRSRPRSAAGARRQPASTSTGRSTATAPRPRPSPQRRRALLGFAAGSFRVGRPRRRRRRGAAGGDRRTSSTLDAGSCSARGRARRRRLGAAPIRRPALGAGRPRPQRAPTSACRC